MGLMEGLEGHNLEEVQNQQKVEKLFKTMINLLD